MRIALALATIVAAAAPAEAAPAPATRPVTALGAERAFAADAQTMGQWAAFRKWADPSAVMWVPQAVWAQDFLKDRKEPKAAVRWWPSHSWTSCDGRTAVNVGPWWLPNATGRFITLWMKQRSGDWRWTADGQLEPKGPFAVPAEVAVRRAACGNPRLRQRMVEAAYARPSNRTAPPGDSGYARSADGTLLVNWTVSAEGLRRMRVQQWTGRRFATVVDETVKPE